MKQLIGHFINGRRIEEENNARAYPIYNPATGQISASLSPASEALCDEAIAIGKKASIGWANTPPSKRAKVLFKFRELLEKHKNELARTVSAEHGKTLEDAQGSIARGLEIIEFHCGIVQQLQGHHSAEVAQHIDCLTIKQPVGLCLGISPFNFPVMVPLWMLTPALVCGNSFILKPSEQTPSAPLRLMELLSDSGLPPGVAQCLQGDKEVVRYLIDNPHIDAVTAVASSTAAQSIYTQASAQGKRAHTFGGAKNHAVVLPDADFSETAKAIVGAAYGSAGERCMALSVLIAVTEAARTELLKHLSPLIHAIRVGPGDDPHSDMGPLISQKHRQNVIAAIDKGIEEGAKLLIDGRSFIHPKYPEGYFMGPCLFDRVSPEMSIYQNELFGPVLCLLTVDSFEEALALVNAHQYGNGTALFTSSGYYARAYSQLVQVGMVGINIPIPVPIASHPFGGWKRSAFGDSNMHGEESIHFYTKRKTITSKWSSAASSKNTFIMPTHE